MSDYEDDMIEVHEDMDDDDRMDDVSEGDIEIEEEGGEGEGDDDDDVETLMENTYYNAKQTREENPDEALELFQTVLDMQETKGKWGHRSLQKIVKLLFQLKKFDEMIERYKELLEEYMTAVPRNEIEESINRVLNLLSNTENVDKKVLEDIYAVTLKALSDGSNEKLWFSTKLKQAKLYYDAKDWDNLLPIIKELKKWCYNEDGSENIKKASQLLDVSVLEIQMYTEMGDSKKLKELVPKAIRISKGAVILNPKVTGIIRECSGKMNMREKDWSPAYTDFFEAFKSYDEVGEPRRINMLKYLVLANMLMSSTTDPFEINEARPYKNHKEIEAMRNLVNAYQREDIKTFEQILRTNKQSIAEDDFMKNYIVDLLKNMRGKVILSLVKPYSRMSMKYIANELSVDLSEVERLCVDLILDGKLEGHIDQINQRLILESAGRVDESSRYKTCAKWATKLGDLHTSLLNKIG